MVSPFCYIWHTKKIPSNKSLLYTFDWSCEVVCCVIFVCPIISYTGFLLTVSRTFPEERYSYTLIAFNLQYLHLMKMREIVPDCAFVSVAAAFKGNASKMVVDVFFKHYICVCCRYSYGDGVCLWYTVFILQYSYRKSQQCQRLLTGGDCT